MTTSAAIEHAYALARSGHYRSVAEVLRRLSDEERTVVEAHLGEHSARRELILICSEAWLSSR